MAQPVWRTLKDQQKVPDPQGVQWTRVLDCAPARSCSESKCKPSYPWLLETRWLRGRLQRRR